MAISLGKLIRLLETEPQDNQVSFDFCCFEPTKLASYRGDYSQLALGWREYAEPNPTVGELVRHLKDSIGKTFHGWKGGDYVASEQTPVWVANSGEGGSTAIRGLADCNWKTVIATEYQDGM